MAASKPLPETPRLTTMATAEAAAMASPVSWVRRLARATRAVNNAGSGGVAMPTGAMRMAAPLVVPRRPVWPGGVPASNASIAARVEGPRMSASPRASMLSCQASRSRAQPASSNPSGSATSRRARSSVCSVSSVTCAAFSPRETGWPSNGATKPSIRP